MSNIYIIFDRRFIVRHVETLPQGDGRISEQIIGFVGGLAHFTIGDATLRKDSVYLVDFHAFPIRRRALEVVLETMDDVSSCTSGFRDILSFCLEYLSLHCNL